LGLLGWGLVILGHRILFDKIRFAGLILIQARI
jgi:hypothetical protein